MSMFKAYDIRGVVPAELDSDIAYRIGRAYADVIQPNGAVAVGRDARPSGVVLSEALIDGLNASGVDVVDLGQCGTELVYFAAAEGGLAGGIMVTASHNPAHYNGMKLVREQARPVSSESGLRTIEALMRQPQSCFANTSRRGSVRKRAEIFDRYVERVRSFASGQDEDSLHLVVNAGNGTAGPSFDAIANGMKYRITRIHHEPDGSFPNGVPNPLLIESRHATSRAIRMTGADLGIAWDGDFDRCFFFDERGQFIEGYYIVGLIASILLARYPGERVLHDPRLLWNTEALVRAAGGQAIMTRTGHAFLKERMRDENALYGGEMSGHHYFRGFGYCDSGMIPWILVAEHLVSMGTPLSELLEERMQAFPCSGEINFRVADVGILIAEIESYYRPRKPNIDRTDGLTVEFPEWRFNLRGSNTEPLLRLNVETRSNPELLSEMTEEITGIIKGWGTATNKAGKRCM
jgi:phosphomannomutase